MHQFDFIADDDFRNSLQCDFAEMTACLDAGAWKASLVLAGSIVEAVVLDTLVVAGMVSREHALKLDLAEAVTLAREKNILTQRTTDLTSVIRGYRNLIHPGRVIRDGEAPSSEAAVVAKNLVSMVLAEVETKRRANYGYTAAQIASKLRSDPSAASIIPHLVKEMGSTEIDRLLTSVLPEEFKEAEANELAPGHVIPAVIRCYRIALENADENLKKRILASFVRVIKEENDERAARRAIALFRGNDLALATPTDRRLIIAYLSAQLDTKVDMHLLEATRGIGAFLALDMVGKLADPLIRTALTPQGSQLARLAANRIVDLWRETPTGVDAGLVQRVDEWIAFLNQQHRAADAEILDGLKTRMLDVPF